MNIRKQIDYNAMYSALDTLIAASFPQMELYCEIGKLVSAKPEKGTAVAASEYLSKAHPDIKGFSPRNLRRMREFYKAYKDTPEVLAEAMTIGWTQNVVILEGCENLKERVWYIRTVHQFGWTKIKLLAKIQNGAYQKDYLAPTQAGDNPHSEILLMEFALQNVSVQMSFSRLGRAKVLYCSIQRTQRYFLPKRLQSSNSLLFYSKSEAGDSQMGFLAMAGHVSTFLTIASSVQNAIQSGPKFLASIRLKCLRGTLDFSALPAELADVLDKAEGYLAEIKLRTQEGVLFSPEEEADFVKGFFEKYPNTRPYQHEVEAIISDYVNQLEFNLLELMSTGEKLIYHQGQQIARDTERIIAKLDELSSESPTVPPPDSVPKIPYEVPNDYISRKVIPHEVAMLNEFERVFQTDRPIPLAEAFETNSHLLLLSDAGHGKSVELQNMAGILCETSRFPVLYSLNLYCGGPICELLPGTYRDLPPERLALLFDGYDEMQAVERDEFMRRLLSFVKDNASAKVVISSRSNFCNAEIGNQSRIFQGFQVYHLDDLSNNDIQDYLSRNVVDATHFSEAAEQSGTTSLLRNPFYLTRLVRLYQKDSRLPGKTEVMDYLIKESFHLDDQKFQGSLEDRRRNLFILLEKTAFAMQLMQKSALDDSEEYQELFPTQEERSLLKCSGLLQKNGTSWCFAHNNFKEYLSAKYLSTLPQKESIQYFSDGYDIKISWVNTFGFLLSMKPEWDLKSWVLEHAPAALIKFNPDHLETIVRVDIFKSAFLERERTMLWLSDGMYSLEQMAAFACYEESLEFLLDKISHPVHRTSQISAIQLLQYFSRLFGRQEETVQTLLACCIVPADGNGGLCYNALEALSKLKLVTPEIASELTARYENCADVHARWGMYRLLVHSGQHNAHVQFFLNGIAYTHGNNRISNEIIALVDGLRALTEPESIQTALLYLAQTRLSLFEEDDVYDILCNRAAEQFSQGQAEYYQTFIECYVASTKHLSQRKMRAIAHFFEVTDTIENAIDDLCNILKRVYYLDALFSRPESITYVERTYRNGKLENHALFRDIVQRYASDAQYPAYQNLILEIDGITIPERKPYIDYEKVRQAGTQKYFDMLFDREKLEQQLLLAIQKAALPDPTLKELTDALIFSSDDPQYASPAWYLCCGLRRFFRESTDAKQVLQAPDWTHFVLSETSSLIQHTQSLRVSDEQKSALCELIPPLYAQGLLDDAVTYNGSSIQVSSFVAAVISLTVYLELAPKEAALLQMTELPVFCFSEKDDTLKYVFLRSHLPEEALRQRIIENVNGGKVHGTVLRDHIQYCAKNDWEDIRSAAIMAAKTDEIARTAAISYLYELFGSRCIEKELLPDSDQVMLLDIERLCPNLPKEPLRAAIERAFKTAPSLELMAHLLPLGSETALREYIRLVEKDKAPPENDRNSLNGPTTAISTLRNPKLLPLLERLIEIALSPDFQDGEFCSLRSSLSNALVGCGNVASEEVTAILLSHQGTPEENEYAFRFCSYTLDLLKQKIRIQMDAPWKLRDVKRIL